MARKKKVPTADGETQGDDNSKTIDISALTDDQKQALHFSWEKKWAADDEIVREARKRQKETEKAIKKELGPNGVADVKFGVSLKDPLKEARYKTQLENEARIARWHGLPLGVQAGLFDDDRTPAAEKAHAEGKRAGLAGEDRSCRYHESTEQYARWMDGYQAGQAVLTAGFKTIAETDGEKAVAASATVDSLTDKLAICAAEGKALLDEMGDDPRPRFLRVVDAH